MIEIDNVLVTADVINEQFVCDLNKCKGACCVEGDLGAPLEDDELVQLEKVYAKVKPYMSKEGIAEVERQGKYIMDWEDDYSTPTINDRECAYAVYADNGILHCAIEKAYNDGEIDFKKPQSCSMYPIRISKLKNGEALNYDRWEICSDACTFGERLKVPVYKFLKDPLISKYGKEWYEKLEELVNKEKS